MKLGIDFGTTHTVVAMADRGNYPVVHFEYGEAVPSLIAVRESDGDLRFGAEAAALAQADGWTVLRSFKRLLHEAGLLTEVTVGGHFFLLKDLLTHYLSHLKWEIFQHSNAGLKRGETLETAVSVPANSLGAQRFLTVDAFRQAGFGVAAVLNEPSAAGFEYASRYRQTLASRREYVLVYDLGGGTFDASLIHMTERSNEVIVSAGIQRLGGDDFDEAILKLVLDKSDCGDIGPGRRAALLEECRRRKEGVEPNTRRFVMDLAALDGEPFTLPMEEVYGACLPLVSRTMEVLEPMVQNSGGAVTWNEVASIYTVGGATHFPIVYRKLRERFGAHRVKRSLHPFAATAIGLAIFLDEQAGYRLTERLGRHFGVWREDEGGRNVRFDVIFPKGSHLPEGDEPPLLAARRYRAAHNIGYFRFVECGRIQDGNPGGDILPWGEIRFPFEPSLREGEDLSSVTVLRLGEGPEVEERYRCGADGIIEVTIILPERGFSREYRIIPPGVG